MAYIILVYQDFDSFLSYNNVARLFFIYYWTQGKMFFFNQNHKKWF